MEVARIPGYATIGKMSPLDTLFTEVYNKYASFEWNVFEIVGFSLFLVALFAGIIVRFFSKYLLLKWSARQATGSGRQEPTETKIRKFLFPIFTNDPNDEFKPYLPHAAPFGIAMICTMIIGAIIMAFKSYAVLFGSLVLLILILIACYAFGRRQAKRGK